uniref:ditrans,polycis-polyprenyl diphosphate synthase [(2E,6E)-farnesyldiphosphate specific] n=1 Tax=Pyramimonas obovata TaxID=1411642 RepID=A0A7S0R219_9CHLO|mmetsp:Transcript_2386/g.4866  ORF Transcript_2386/g.4866 Transcript_2386/m.4866 type:complete len:302 (+) Transcript_2386:381-1286(+)
MASFTFVWKLLLWVLHLAYALREMFRKVVGVGLRLIHLTGLQPNRGVVFMLRQLVCSPSDSDPEFTSNAKQLPPPKAIALIVTQEHEAKQYTHQIVDVLHWCVEIGIQKIYLYDPQGVLETTVADLDAICVQRQSNDTRGSSSGDEQIPSRSLAFSVGLQGISAPQEAPRQVPVEVISARLVADSLKAELVLPPPPTLRKDLLQAERDGVDLIAPGLVEPEEGNARSGPPHEIEAALRRPCESNPLEVAFVFGPHYTLAGFPPWMTHLCEISHMGSLEHVSRSALSASMNKYRKINQRFGR